MKVKNCDICGKECTDTETGILFMDGQDIDLCFSCSEPLMKIIDSPNKNYKIEVK